jgi:hypothetical protein
MEVETEIEKVVTPSIIRTKKTLSFSSEVTADRFDDVLKILSQNPMLESLRLFKCDIGNHMDALIGTLKKLNKLSHLAIQGDVSLNNGQEYKFLNEKDELKLL